MKPKTGDKKYIVDVESPPADATAPPVFTPRGTQNQYGLPHGFVPAVASWSWDHLVASTISVFICNLCGIPALVLSLLAYVDHRTNLHASARSRRRSALILAITGICIGMLFYSLIVASWCYWAYQGLESDGNMPEMDEDMTSQMPPGWEDSHERLMEDMMGSREGRFGSHESHEGGMGRRPPPPH